MRDGGNGRCEIDLDWSSCRTRSLPAALMLGIQHCHIAPQSIGHFCGSLGDGMELQMRHEFSLEAAWERNATAYGPASRSFLLHLPGSDVSQHLVRSRQSETAIESLEKSNDTAGRIPRPET
ncbi:hypothetical protein AC579_9172 [Pseudocercospora musae]|uniref:Uncharacterized protein n=1 Tax=Pseudocercospora musae TaxID=113226 RepID=A0A139I7R9_9PEZI|nr:hypothetical protein AC579_9172 [Pseudocercospora musae]